MNFPDRRAGITMTLQHAPESDGPIFDVTFNQHPETLRFAECFYTAVPVRGQARVKYGSDLQAMISDACIAISKQLEGGGTFSEIAAAFGENRDPGAMVGPPASLFGTIARAGAALDAEGINLYANH